MRSLAGRSCKPVRTVVQGGCEGKSAAELMDLRAGQRHLLDTLEQFVKRWGAGRTSSRSQTLSHRLPRRALNGDREIRPGAVRRVSRAGKRDIKPKTAE